MKRWGAMPVRGLGDLGAESRMITTPWSRMVRGLGLGQYPVGYDPTIAKHLHEAFDLIVSKVPDASGYVLFCRLLGTFVLDVTAPFGGVARRDLTGAVEQIKDAVRSEPNPYYRVGAGCILMDSLAKLGLDTALLINDRNDFAQELLAMVDEIGADNIQDNNIGRHGDYEKLFAYTAVFLSFGNLGIGDRLISGHRNLVLEALHVLDKIPAPFFRGRGGAMLFSAISLLGYETFVFDGERDYLRDVLDYMDSANSVSVPVTFPQPTTPTFQKIYPLVTMLNAIAISGRKEYMWYGRDRLRDMKSYWAEISPVERAHMSLYYIVALYNLGKLDEEIPALDKFVAELVDSLEILDPGADFFLHGLSNAYIVETAMLTGRMDLIDDAKLNRIVDCFPDLDRSDIDRINRPYPFSYALNVLGEIGQLSLLFKPRERYHGLNPAEWVIANLSDGGRAEGNRLFMLGNALVSQALRLRYVRARETPIFEKFSFNLP
jgi:hypothetical protein